MTFSEVVFSLLKHLDTGFIDKFGNLIEKAVDSEAEAAGRKFDEIVEADPNYEWKQEYRELVFGELWQVRELRGAFLLVALNQSFETALVRCLDEILFEAGTLPDDDEARGRELKKVRRSPVMERLESVVPDFAQTTGAREVEELQHIVNAWKHDGFVSEKLSKRFPTWERFRPLDDLGAHYARLKPGVYAFSKEIGAQLHEKWRSLHTAKRALASGG